MMPGRGHDDNLIWEWVNNRIGDMNKRISN